ncbi:MAG: hypothetical protein H7321_09850, partial [Bacteroidia bacterium]|nr:hypothetical protein [Bacteroidia bacterium]
QVTNIGLGFGKKFTSNISGGAVFRIVNEATPDVRAMGVCLDAGVQYGTQFRPNSKTAQLKGNDLRFGISIRNIGPDMKFSGDGLSAKSNLNGNPFTTTTVQRGAAFNLPSLINIGMSYDFRLDKNKDSTATTYYHKLTAAGNFCNNSFSNNQTSIGIQYSYKGILMLRSGYTYEKGIFGFETRRTVYTGFSGGVTIEVPLAKKNSTSGTRDNNNTFAFDYSYRTTSPFQGTHVFGIRLNLE